MQQASFYKDHKFTLKPKDLLITSDFSENYSFILQNAAQGFHWDNSQATIDPFVAYYIEPGELCHLSLWSYLTVCSTIQFLSIRSKKADCLFDNKTVFKSSKILLLFWWSSIQVQKSQEFNQLVPPWRRL